MTFSEYLKRMEGEMNQSPLSRCISIPFCLEQFASVALL